MTSLVKQNSSNAMGLKPLLDSVPAGAERGDGVPASDGGGGSGGAKPPGIMKGASRCVFDSSRWG